MGASVMEADVMGASVMGADVMGASVTGAGVVGAGAIGIFGTARRRRGIRLRPGFPVTGTADAHPARRPVVVIPGVACRHLFPQSWAGHKPGKTGTWPMSATRRSYRPAA